MSQPVTAPREPETGAESQILSAVTTASELARLCADRPLRTIETFTPNDFYGNATVMKLYAGLPAEFVIRAIIPHGAKVASKIWEPELRHPLETLLVYSEDQRTLYRRSTKKKLELIGAPFFYAARLIEAELEQLRQNAQGTLVFPCHSTHHLTAHYDQDGFIEFLQGLPEAMHPIRVCLYWRDAQLGRHEAYERAGFQCVSAGHIYDPWFLFRLARLLAGHRFAAANRLGSSCFYAAAFGLPVRFCRQESKYSSTNPKMLAEVAPKLDLPVSENFYATAELPLDQAATIQRRLAEETLGLASVLSPDSLRSLLTNLPGAKATPAPAPSLLKPARVSAASPAGQTVPSPTRALSSEEVRWRGVRFLDPTGRLFEHENEIYRAIYPKAEARVRSLFQQGIVEKLCERGLLIDTTISPLALSEFGLVLRHRRLPFTTRPDEWCRSCLRDAALAVIDLNLELLKDGLGTIDAHPANVEQGNDCRPVWVDFGSIVPLRDASMGLGELNKCFLRPLRLLTQSPELGRLVRLLGSGGLEPAEAKALFGDDPTFPLSNRQTWLQHARDWVASLQFGSLNTTWKDYHSEQSLSEMSPRGPRAEVILRILAERQPKRVVDLGCNAGLYAFSAARLGAQVCATDFDEAAVDRLYLTARSKAANFALATVVRDVTSARSQQTYPLQGDLVLALALTHHLAISQKFPFSVIGERLASYSTEALVTEFMPNGLGGTRPVPNPLPPSYTLSNFCTALSAFFTKVEPIHYPVPEGHSQRVLVFCQGRIEQPVEKP